MLLGSRRRVDYSVESSSAMNRNLRDSNSQMRGSAKNLKELGSLRDSGSIETALNDFSIKKNKRINGVQLAPLNHHPPPTSLKSNINILSQNRASIPLSSRHESTETKMTAADINTMALLQKELLSAGGGSISPHMHAKVALLSPINGSKPPMLLNPINHKPPVPMAPEGPLSSLNYAEKANRPQLDPINLSQKRAGRGISSTSRSGFTSQE